MRPISWKYRLYRAIYLYIQKKLKEEYKMVHRCDNRCSNCKRWNSEVSINHESKVVSTSFGFYLDCGACGSRTYWNTGIAPVAISCDSNGNPD